METKQFLNLYSISFRVGDVEFGHQLRSVKIHKNVTNTHFVEDLYIFDKTAVDLFNALLAEATVEISINRSGSYRKIYKSKGIISKVEYNDEKIYVFFETYQKLNWMRKNGVSIVCEHATVKEGAQKFVDKVDYFYKHKNKTLFWINFEKNINNYRYENLFFPIKKNNFDTVYQICKNYFILNSPFYLFLDDYNFDENIKPVALNIYDLSEIKSLRAVLLSDLHTSTRPLVKTTGSYYDTKAYYNIEKMQRFDNNNNNYSHLKPTFQLDPENRFKYNEVPDTEQQAVLRQKKNKMFFAKAARYYKYELQDFDLTKFKIGYRFVDDTSNAKIQYAQAIVDAEIRFYAAGKHDVIENRGEAANQFLITAKFTTITN